MTQSDPEIGSNIDDGPAASVGYATSNWLVTHARNHFANVALPADGFQPLPQHRPVNADVSYTLHRWLSKTPGVQLPNWGFVVIGHNEGFPHNNDTWIGRYDWTLSVDFFASQNPRMKGLGTGASQ